MDKILRLSCICYLALLTARPSSAAEPPKAPVDLVNKKAPAWVVEDWVNGPPDFTGKFILIDLWATWCGPCRKTIPELNEWHHRYKDKLVIVGISNESAAIVQKMAQPKIEYYTAVDPRARLERALRVTAIPYVLLLDPDGIVRWQGFPLEQGHQLTEEVLQGILNHSAENQRR